MGSIWSDRQASDSVAAARRKLSASTRRVRSIETGRKPIASSISMNGTTASSSSRTRSFGAGVAPPVASRISISRFNGRPVQGFRNRKHRSPRDAPESLDERRYALA
jgi:hypothetical protein